MKKMLAIYVLAASRRLLKEKLEKKIKKQIKST
jgi:hypothetical protein